jgi:Na+/H+-translocating membrane pyrophosphatase
MDILFIVGMTLWTIVVAMLVGILMETARAEDRREVVAEVRKPVREAAPRPALVLEPCYERCMRQFLWSPGKKVVCENACAA